MLGNGIIMSGRRLQDQTLPSCSDHSIVIPELSQEGSFSTEAFEIDNHVHLIFIANSCCPGHPQVQLGKPSF